MMPPILKEVKAAHGDNIRIVKIDVDKNQNISMKYQIRSIPTLMIFQKGEIAWRHTGVASAAQINKALNEIGVTA
jgi:thioredoxin 1